MMTHICPDCRGRKTGTVHVYGERDGRRFGEWRETKCRTCDGLGWITERELESLETGMRLREDRLSRGMTLREEARRIGISAKELSDRENGRCYED
jgi:hypothetical protein